MRMICCLSLLFLCSTLSAQDAGHKGDLTGHTSGDYKKCEKCAPSLAKALDFVKQNYKKSRLPGHIYAGFLFLAEPSGQYNGDLEYILNYACRSIKQERFGANWHLAMCMFFLTEYCLKYPNEKAKKALEEALPIAKKNAETDTGGWCHSFEMWKKDGYNKRGGARAMGMITGIAYGGLLEMKSAVGVDPGELLPQTQKALKGMTDGGGGFTYGYDNGMGDLAMSRACYVLMGLQATGNYSHPFYTKITKSLKQRYKNCFRGHAFAPLHYFSVASAMHRLGKAEYAKFFSHYINWLMEKQKESGEVPMQSDSGKRPDCDQQMDPTSSTAVYALIILMQKDGIFNPKAKKKGQTAKKGGIFGNRPVKTVSAKPYLGLRAKYQDMLELVVVTDVVDAGPTSTAGLRNGDLILSFRGRSITNLKDLRTELDKCAPGKKAVLMVVRAGDKKKISVTLGDLKKDKEKNTPSVEGELF